MRFNKLRLFVAIAMLIFVLVVGNIILAGMTHDNQQQNVAIIDVKKSSAGAGASVQTGTGANNGTTNTSAGSNTNTASTGTTIVHKIIKTRAS